MRRFVFLAATALAAAADIGPVRAARAQAVEGKAVQEEAPDASLQKLEYAFDQMTLAGTGFTSLTAVRGRNNSVLKRKLTWLDREYHLSEEQKQRLEFAARGDVKRLEDWLDRERQKFVTAHQLRQAEADNASPDLAALQRVIKAGPFGEQSLLAKMAARIPTPEQIERHERRRQLAANSHIKITPENVGALIQAGRWEKDVRAITWDSKTNHVAWIGKKQPLEICSGDDFRPLRTFGEGRELVSFDLCPTKDLLALGVSSGKAFLIDGASGKEIALDTKTEIPTVRFSPNGKYLATGGNGTRGILWSTEDGARIRDFDTGPSKGELTLAFSPDSRILAIGNRASLTDLFDVESGMLRRALPFPMPRELKFDASGKRIASAFGTGHLAVWDVQTAEILRIVKTHADDLCSVDWSPDGKLIASAGRNVPVTLWQAQSLAPLCEIESPEWVWCVRFNPSGTRLIFAGSSPGHNPCVEIYAVPAE